MSNWLFYVFKTYMLFLQYNGNINYTFDQECILITLYNAAYDTRYEWQEREKEADSSWNWEGNAK